MGRQRRVYHPKTPEFPGDFPLRLERFKDRAGLTWRELARRLRVDARSVRRWRAGTRPGPAHLFSLFNLAEELGGREHLLRSAQDHEDIGGHESAHGH